MSSNLFHLVTLFLGLFLLNLLPSANGALYVVTPRDGSTCRGGQPCTVTWLDDGRAPLLTAIGISTVGLYTGNEKLLQTIPPVDVGKNLSFTFTPDPAVGPDSGAYYIAFKSTEAKNGTDPYVAYSPWFRLEGMSGSFDRPVPSATKSIPIPTELTLTPSSTTSRSTITVGTLSTATPEPSMSISTPSTSPSSSPSSPSPSSSSTSSSSTSTSSRIVTSVVPPSTTATTSASSSSNNRPLENGAPTLGLSPLVLCLCLVAALVLS